MKRKYRDETGMYLLEGRKPLKDALSLGVNIKKTIICEGSREDPEIMELLKDNAVVLDKKLFETITDTGHSQGMISIIEKKVYEINDLKNSAGTGSNIVVLDRLQDPGNAGTIIRTAEAAGYCAIMVMPGCSDIYSPKVVRAAAGSLFRMPVIYSRDYDDAVGKLKALKKKIVVTSLDTDTYYFDTDLSSNIALVIGNEGQGVSREFLDSADIKIKIPMEGSIESLNAAVAAGILMYQSHKTK